MDKEQLCIVSQHRRFFWISVTVSLRFIGMLQHLDLGFTPFFLRLPVSLDWVCLIPGCLQKRRCALRRLWFVCCTSAVKRRPRPRRPCHGELLAPGGRRRAKEKIRRMKCRCKMNYLSLCCVLLQEVWLLPPIVWDGPLGGGRCEEKSNVAVFLFCSTLYCLATNNEGISNGLIWTASSWYILFSFLFIDLTFFP